MRKVAADLIRLHRTAPAMAAHAQGYLGNARRSTSQCTRPSAHGRGAVSCAPRRRLGGGCLHSAGIAVFFAGYLALHLSIPFRLRIYLVIFGGAAFYAWWRVSYLWVPLLLTVFAWLAGLWISAASERSTRKRRLIASVVAIFLPLAIVKYTHFIAFNVLANVIDPATCDSLPMASRWALPLGISFITFTVTAYVVDVYRQRYAPESDVRVLFGYVLFFPHLIAGPILRPHELMPQLKRFRDALGARFITGAMIFTLGAFKKLVFADQLAAVVEPAFAPDAPPTAAGYALAVYAFAVQIYCDFSGYTDMAIGLAYMLRIRLRPTFSDPTWRRRS